MVCPRCGTQSLPEANYCEICGLQLIAPASGAPDQERPAIQPAQSIAETQQTAPASTPWPVPAALEELPFATSGAQSAIAPVAEPQPSLPLAASGWTFGGFVPFGLYSFMNGMPAWGWVGLICQLLWFVPLLGFAGMLSYAIYVGVYGRHLAWRQRRFASLNQYLDTMQEWNTWGAAMLITGALLYFMTACTIIAAISDPGSGGLY